MKCPSCNAEMKVGRENYQYAECGLPYVTLRHLEVRRCPDCGEYEVVIPHMEGLHKVLAQTVAMKRAPLSPDEIRFLRKYLGFSGTGFAAAVGTSPETLSRWEHGKAKMNTAAERSLRLMVFAQPQITVYPDLHKLREIESDGRQPLKVRADYSKKNWTTVVAVKKALLAAREMS